MQQYKKLKIEFDGGSRSNIPPFGLGYGSYQITEFWNKEERICPIRRMNWQECMSANAAEIRTIVEALMEVIDSLEPVLDRTHLSIFGDSQIAINRIIKAWHLKGQIPKFAESNSRFMVKWATELCRLVPRFATVEAQWHSRENSVALFGH